VHDGPVGSAPEILELMGRLQGVTQP
jgi:hypothetical protein